MILTVRFFLDVSGTWKLLRERDLMVGKITKDFKKVPKMFRNPHLFM